MELSEQLQEVHRLRFELARLEDAVKKMRARDG
jgi:hypothetical protein